MSTDTEHSESAGVRTPKAIIREDILQNFPGLFGSKTINAAAFSRTGPRKICLAEVGRHL